MSRVRELFDRRPFNSPWIARNVSRYALPWWFAFESVLGIAVAMQDRRYLFFDARLYLDATRAWLAGSKPWDVQLAGNYFAPRPPPLLAFPPLTLLPDGIAVGIVALAVIALPVPGNGLLALGALALVTWSNGDHGVLHSFGLRRRKQGPVTEGSLGAEGAT